MTAVQTSVLAPGPLHPAETANRSACLDVERVRQEFPILREMPYGKPLVYLDSAATNQKPEAVIDAISAFYSRDNANVHRGTPNLAGAVGLGAAIDFLGGLGHEALAAHEHDVLAYGVRALSGLPGLRLIGTAPAKASVMSFVLDGVHPHDIGTILDRHGVAIRTGHHCAQPLLSRLGLAATARAVLACYSTRQDIDALVAGLDTVQEAFR